MKRPTKPGIYKFTQTKPATLPFSKGDWVVGIVFRQENPLGEGKNVGVFMDMLATKPMHMGFRGV